MRWRTVVPGPQVSTRPAVIRASERPARSGREQHLTGSEGRELSLVAEPRPKTMDETDKVARIEGNRAALDQLAEEIFE